MYVYIPKMSKGPNIDPFGTAQVMFYFFLKIVSYILWSVCKIISKPFQSIVLYSAHTKFLTSGIQIDILQQFTVS